MVKIIIFIFYIVINNIKQQITEHEKNLIFGKDIAQVSVVLLIRLI